jgi:uncharacterized membrane protein YeiH
VALAAALLCFAIRMLAIRRSWQLPAPPAPTRSDREMNPSSVRKDD